MGLFTETKEIFAVFQPIWAKKAPYFNGAWFYKMYFSAYSGSTAAIS